MKAIGQYSLLIVGVIMALGGIMGFVKAKSKASLMSGVISGAILIGLYFIVPINALAAFAGGGAVCLALAVVFFTRWRKTQKVMPSAMLFGVSLVEFAILFAAASLG